MVVRGGGRHGQGWVKSHVVLRRDLGRLYFEKPQIGK